MSRARLGPGLGRAVTLALLAGLAATRGSAQNYGLNDQLLTVDATSFLGFGTATLITGDGYLNKQDPGDGILFAPLQLPDGAVITQICLSARNLDASNVVNVSLQAVKLATPGQPPGVVPIPGTLVLADFHDGYGEVCTNPISYEFHEIADVDGDQTPELVAHRLRAFLPFADVALGGVRITWHRQVSPAPAVATFPDVPTSHPFFQYVEALYAAGITAGYGNGNFGVNDPITRGQMAVFLAKALGLHWSH
jgi:hypothetical protein